MNTKITLSWLLLFCNLFAFAQNSGRLTIKSQNGESFFVFVNNQQLNNRPQSAVLIDDLHLPEFELVVRVAGSNARPARIEHLSTLDSEGKFRHVTYQVALDNRRNRLQLEFESMLHVNYRSIIPKQVFIAHYLPEVVQEQPHPIYQSPYETQQPVGCINAYPMKSDDFQEALTAIKKQPFDATKLKIAKQIISVNCLTADQIIPLCKLFAFEDNKLDFAKFAYDFCVDPGNYYKVNNVFSFSSNAEALSDYVMSKG